MAAADTGELRSDPEILGRLDDLPISRSDDRAVRVGSTEIIPATCDAEVLAVSAQPPRLVATCVSATQDAPVELFGPGFHKVLGTRVRRGDRRAVQLLDTPYMCPTPRSCVAVDDGSPIALPGIARTIAGSQILVEIGLSFWISEGRTGARVPLMGVQGNWHLRSGGILAIGTTVVDLAKARVVGQVPIDPVAVDTAGRALVPERRDLEVDMGPLHWLQPRP